MLIPFGSPNTYDSLSEEYYLLQKTMKRAPPSPPVEPAYRFWVSAIAALTGDDLRQWGNGVCESLCHADCDLNGVLDTYDRIALALGRVEAKVSRLVDDAFEEDPSSRLGMYSKVNDLWRHARLVTTIVQELVMFRGEGLQSLVDAKADRAFTYQTL